LRGARAGGASRPVACISVFVKKRDPAVYFDGIGGRALAIIASWGEGRLKSPWPRADRFIRAIQFPPARKSNSAALPRGTPAQPLPEPPRGMLRFPRRLPMAHKILSESEIASGLKPLKDWSVKGQNIEAAFEFQTFRDAIAFIVQVAIEAEVLNHHPEFFNSYNKVSFSFCTHDVGNKITDADIEIAGKISAAAHRFLSMK
jgi:4a-hydroxytetrahydrobiopterin dehydratase